MDNSEPFSPSNSTAAFDDRRVIPLARTLRALEIEVEELQDNMVTVSGSGLRALLRAFACYQPFDPEFYAGHQPDIKAARANGTITNLHRHFVENGFFEGRLPSEPSFDAAWYFEHYEDVAQHFPKEDVIGLRNHYFRSGIFEGRSGTEAEFHKLDPLAFEK